MPEHAYAVLWYSQVKCFLLACGNQEAFQVHLVLSGEESMSFRLTHTHGREITVDRLMSYNLVMSCVTCPGPNKETAMELIA